MLTCRTVGYFRQLKPEIKIVFSHNCLSAEGKIQTHKHKYYVYNSIKYLITSNINNSKQIMEQKICMQIIKQVLAKNNVHTSPFEWTVYYFF